MKRLMTRKGHQIFFGKKTNTPPPLRRILDQPLLLIATLTWSELRSKLQAVEQEKETLAQEAVMTKELMSSRLQQSEENERRLRSDIRAAELDNLRRQHAALKTS